MDDGFKKVVKYEHFRSNLYYAWPITMEKATQRIMKMRVERIRI